MIASPVSAGASTSAADQPSHPRLRKIPPRAPLALAALCATLASLALVSSAWARQTHALDGAHSPFAITQPSPSPFASPFGISVDNSTNPADPSKGDVYVDDFGHGQVVKFDPNGNQLAVIGGFANPAWSAVDPANGDLYVGDYSGGFVEKLDPSGNPITAWATNGRLALPGAPAGIAVSPANGDLYVAVRGPQTVSVFDPSGNPIAQFSPTVAANLDSIAVDSSGDVYVVDELQNVTEYKPSENPPTASTTYDSGTVIDSNGAFAVAVDPLDNHIYVAETSPTSVIREFDPTGHPLDSFGAAQIGSSVGLALSTSHVLYGTDLGAGNADIFLPVTVPDVTTTSATVLSPVAATLNGEVDPAGGGNVTECRFEYGETASYGESVPCLNSEGHEVGTAEHPIEAPAEVHAHLTGLDPATTYHFRLAASNANAVKSFGSDQALETPPAIASLSTDPATELHLDGATLNGSLNPDGIDTSYYFQYGIDTNYGQTTATQDAGAGTHTAPVPGIPISGLSSNHTYHYRIVATNEFGTTLGQDQLFQTPSAPTIDAFSSSEVAATSAVLHAQVNPQGFETKYHFEYGTTTAYGTSLPVPPEALGSGTSDQGVSVHLEDLQPLTYHFRVLATNEWGTTATADQTFNFYPPSCPNAHIRQQTGSGFLPDCRAYELVSPANAAGTTLFSGKPNSPLADNRFAFGGGFGEIPGAGEPTNANVDLYVATRTSDGWATKYVGLQGNETLSIGGEATDLSMDRFIDLNGGDAFQNASQQAESAPYVWDSTTNRSLGRWPTNLASVPGGAQGIVVSKPSSDFSHFVFSSNTVAFTQAGGLTAAPGSVYDNDVVKKTVQLVSLAPDGTSIPQDPASKWSGEYIDIPAVSTDGSHILMSTAAGEPVNCVVKCLPSSPNHLYMRVDDLLTYNVSAGQDGLNHAVNYVGMTPDGSRVFFTSKEQLTPDDHDNSVDLYMWSLAADGTATVTRISTADNGAGNTDACTPTSGWTTGCGVVPVFGASGSSFNVTDNSIAAGSGDIYFYSPEQLDGSKGIPSQQNLYLYRAGHVQYVATFSPGHYCNPDPTHTGLGGGPCSNGPVGRIQVSPDGSHMAFVTTQRVTAYDNQGFGEMYTYEPPTGTLKCVSCDPSGAPPTSETQASDNGLFMSNDGRTFFYTANALVPQDTDRINDVYEYVDGRPQLISAGTGTRDVSVISTGGGATARTAGLQGVSADGANVFFSTFDSLVGQDQNGNFLKFYDARTNGGFPFQPPAAPCAAADECHGPGSSAPPPAQIGSAAPLGAGGNASSTRAKHRKRHHHRATPHRRAAKRNRGGRK